MENESERERGVAVRWLAGSRSLDLVGCCVLIGGKISVLGASVESANPKQTQVQAL